MSEKQNTKAEDSPINLADVLADELRHNRPKIERPANTLKSAFDKLHEAKLIALCFSGGGIRSATFGLGVVQALAKHKLLTGFDYLSTVSGGGYLGSWLSAWVYRAAPTDTDGKKLKVDEEKEIDPKDLGIHRVQNIINCRPIGGADKPNPEPTQLQHLREFSNYMSPKTGLLSADTWTLVAIYLRNLFLNLTILIPLIAAILLLPRVLFRSIGQLKPSSELQVRMLFIAMIAGAAAIAFVIGRLPSKTTKSAEQGTTEHTGWSKRLIAFSNTDGGVLLFGVAPLLLSAFLVTTLWAWSHRKLGSLSEIGAFGYSFQFANYHPLVFFLAASVAAFLFGLVLFLIFRWSRGFGMWAVGAALLSSLIGGTLLWLTTNKLFPEVAVIVSNWFGADTKVEWPIYLCFAVPVFLLIVLISATLFVGLTSRKMTDEDREWLARFGALVLTISVAWIVINSLVFFGPWMVEWVFALEPGKGPTFAGVTPILSTAAAIISAVVSLVGGFSGKSEVRHEGVKTWKSTFLAIAPRVGAVVFLLFIFIAIAFATTLLLYFLGYSIGTPSVLGPFPANYDHITVLEGTRFFFLALILLGLTAVGLFMACFVNVNKFSLHGAYRDRLVRAYLGASNKDRKQNTFTGFDDADNIELHALEHQRPLHVINATVNLVGGKNLAWQNRRAASFTMSALHCGSWALKGYRKSDSYCLGTSSRKALRLGTAMAISGAAANPNMGYYSSSIVTFLMSIVNIRLGWWLGNTGEPGSDKDLIFWNRREFYKKESPSIAIWPLINETLGRTDERKHFLNVSDGGHFENLALYEMVLRRCKLIVLSDGAADADFKFGEIANAIQKCKVDLGVDIQFLGSMNIRARSKEKETDQKEPKSRFAIGSITYPETYFEDETDEETGTVSKKEKNHTGWLIYTRPTYYSKNEPRDIMNYAESNEQFPHQSTGDQMYDEKQFEAYRGLGYLTMSEIMKIFLATSKGDPDKEVDDELEDLFAGNDDMRNTIFGFFGLGQSEKFETRKQRQKK
jgi:hypothetical protein